MPSDVGFWWTSTGWWIRPNTARDVMNVLGAIGVYNARQSFGWRGMSSADYRLTSSLQRKLGAETSETEMRAAEVDLLAAAREWGLGIGPGGYVDDLQLLADLQHYGIATRLLDFTSNPMTALWFACQSPKDPAAAKSGVLLALNTTGMRQVSTVPTGRSWSYLNNPAGSTLQDALKDPAPFLVRSAIPNERLRAQEGFFVTGAVPPPRGEVIASPSGAREFRIQLVDPFEAINVSWTHGDAERLAASLVAERQRGHPSAMPFVAVIIKAGLKRKLLRYLENTYNRTAKVLFPDYGGFLEFRSEPAARDTVAD
ncbi:FRG domain-containing protein [Plantibacter sp. VKM Ac-1784]|uniref:FRG domain-containing protein n=1 Tax=Plantibacter elymi (nom. nud.) TaxID=199708 RepID=A0ABY1RBA5_9MICO|nr:FRG domain-containing protein [Plantibacter sp. VKM Ac-1784]SMQ58021.1 FRG domain-containing protein [Plantibacter sp. VKM Ac-1784]